MRSTAQFVVLIVVALMLAFAVQTIYERGGGPSATSTPESPELGAPPDQSVSDGTVTLSYSGDDFGLATNPGQILRPSYIPPCDPGFRYCLYVVDGYEGTNFEGAGVRFAAEPALRTERDCLNVPPEGLATTTEPRVTRSAATYASSVFADVGDAGAGHYAEGDVYRLFVRGSLACYELETRLGRAQAANFPEGTVRELTASEVASIEGTMARVIRGVAIPGGESDLFQIP